jgi:hypothetical protein
MNNDYQTWLHKIGKKECDLHGIQGFKNSYQLHEGMSLSAVWPNDVVMEMNDEHRGSTLLVDSLFNISSLLVLSARVKRYCESQQLLCTEFLPVQIKDHNGSILDEEYFILNVTELVDCLDIDASEAEESMMTDDIDSVNGIVLKQTELLEGRKLFRLKRFGGPTLVTKAFAASVDTQGFSGIRWGALQDYKDKNW